MSNDMEVNVVTFILDDNKDELFIMKREFAKEGLHNIRLFTNEDDFWAHYHKDVHVAVLDYLIHPNTGLDIADKLLEKNPYCRIIIHSGIEDPEVVIKALNMGIYKWIAKNEDRHLDKCVIYVKTAIAEVTPFLLYQQSKHLF